jgi:uncharacterized phage protein (TIGR02218 family)
MSTPVELYRFTIDASVWTWTSGDQSIDYNGETYTPEPIGRSAMEQGQEINRANIKVTVPRTNAIAVLYLTTIPDWPASLTIYRQIGATILAYWKGRIAGASATGSEVTLECESAFSSLRRTGLRARYQTKCRHALYHRGCGLNIDDWKTSGTIDTHDGTELIIPEAAALANGYFTNGIVRDPNGLMRWISRHNGSTLMLTRPFQNMDADIAAAGYGLSYGKFYGGYGVTLHPGCDRTKETCKDRFNNIENHGGFPWIPGRNPFDGSSLV